MNMLDRILEYFTLKNVLDGLAFIIIVLAVIPPYAEVYNVHLPAELLMIIGILLAALKEAERRLQKRLAAEPSAEQESVIAQLQDELSTYAITLAKRNRELIELRSKIERTERVEQDGEPERELEQ